MKTIKTSLLLFLGCFLCHLSCTETGVQQDDSYNGSDDENSNNNQENTDGKYELLKSDKSRITDPSPSQSVLNQLVDANSAFAFDLYSKLRDGHEGNMFFSPFSLSTAMAMQYGGARSSTEKEIAETMHFDMLEEEAVHEAFNKLILDIESRNEPAGDRADSGFSLVLANSFWAQDGFDFLPNYLDLLSTNYGAAIRTIDFNGNLSKSIEIVNGWIAEKTQDKIVNMLKEDELTPPIYSMLINAIYFKAAWNSPFDVKNTAKKEFTLLSGDTVTVDMMAQNEHFSYGKGTAYEAVALPYDGEQLDMVLIAPNAGEFIEFENTMDINKIKDILDNMKHYSQTWVTMNIPKFNISSRWEMKNAFAALGMEAPFDETADFSGMSDEFLRIQKIFHQTQISVDEAGTEASAATVIVDSNGDAEYEEFNLNRPFIFLIRDIPTKSILFVGRVVNPTL